MGERHITAKDALALIEQLQLFVIQRHEAIEALCKQIQMLQLERDELRESVSELQEENDALKRKAKCQHDGPHAWTETGTKSTQTAPLYGQPAEPVTSESQPLTWAGLYDSEHFPSLREMSGSSHCPLHQTNMPASAAEVSSEGDKKILPLEMPEIVLHRPSMSGLDQVGAPMKAAVERSASKKYRRTDSAVLRAYELSVDLRDKTVELLETKYGGKETANRAASAIQQYYRHWVLMRSFHRIRAFSDRRRSVTKMPEKHFQKLKQTSLVFYGPANPVMIIDTDIQGKDPAARLEADAETLQRHELSLDSKVSNAIQLGGDVVIATPCPNVNGCSQNLRRNIFALPFKERLDLTDEWNTGLSILGRDSGTNRPVGANEADTPEAVSEPFIESANGEMNVGAGEELAQDDSPSVARKNCSVDYDVIDDSNVLTVVGRYVDLEDGSILEVDKIYEPDIDHSSSSSENSYYSEASNRYKPSFDKSLQRRQFRTGVNLFNWKPEVGIQYLMDNGLLREDAQSVAEFFRRETTISKQKISEYFGSLKKHFNMSVLLEFAKTFDYMGKNVDEALRQFQSYFKLTGEAQTVEKFLQVFADRYVECNRGGITDSPDAVLILAFALAMLNTDLHNHNVKRRMTVEEFIHNLKGTNDGNDLPEDMLREMYIRIQKNEFATGADHTTQLQQIENSFVGKVPSLSASHRQFVKLFTIEEVYDPNRKDKTHNRLAFLFNDLLLLAKPRLRPSGHHGSGHVFSCKASYSLLNKKVAEFTNEFYAHGVCLLNKLDSKVVASFNTKDEKTRKLLVEELDEYIRETNGMENIRIALTKAKQSSSHTFSRKDERTKSLLFRDQRSRSKSNLDKAETTSLMDLRMDSSLKTSEITVETKSASMNNICEAESGSFTGVASNYIAEAAMARRESSTSLETTYLTTASQGKPASGTSVSPARLPRSATIRKSFFAWGQKRARKADSSLGEKRQSTASMEGVLEHHRDDASDAVREKPGS